MKKNRSENFRRMQKAIAAARRGIKIGAGGPFGAVIAAGTRILAVSHNTVLKTQDPTCHAEINAIREAAKKLKTFDLSRCMIYSTTEPCPMCFSAIHWARIRAVFFGTKIEDVRRRGFNELAISSVAMKRRAKSPVKLYPGFMATECRQLLRFWDGLERKKIY